MESPSYAARVLGRVGGGGFLEKNSRQNNKKKIREKNTKRTEPLIGKKRKIARLVKLLREGGRIEGN